MLNRRQLEEFQRNGILRVMGAVPATDVEAMDGRVWENLERRYSVRREQPETWIGQRVNGFNALDESVTFDEIGNLAVCRMLDDLLGGGNWQRPVRWGSLLIAFPESSGQWDVPCASWHLDLPVSDSLEGLFVLRLFTYLEPLRRGGGATVAIAGSHLLVEDLARKRTMQRLRSADVRSALIRAYPWMEALCSRSETADRIGRFMNVSTAVGGAELQVVEMTGEPGDVYFVHPLILHAPAMNCAGVPRIVLSSFVYRNPGEASAPHQNSRGRSCLQSYSGRLPR
jgi:hypothetical protein